MPPEIQERIRAATVGLFLPRSKILFWTSTGQLMTLKSGGEQTDNRAENQETTPDQIMLGCLMFSLAPIVIPAKMNK